MWKGYNVTGVDGFCTDQTEPNILLRLADCCGFVVFDPKSLSYAALHIGWKGAAKDFHLDAIDRMVEVYESDPKDLIVWLSPCAQAKSYFTTEKPKQMGDPDWKGFISKKGKKYYIDIPGYIKAGLEDKGIKKSNIKDESIDTISDDNYFSHQQVIEGNKGIEELEDLKAQDRFAVVISLK